MNFRIRSVVVAIVLAVGLCVSGVAAPSAQAAPKPKLTTTSVTTSFKTSVGSYKYTYPKAKLSGVKASVKKKIEAEITAFFKSAISSQKMYDEDIEESCYPDYDLKHMNIKGKLEGGVYKSRYLSVYLELAAPGCYDAPSPSKEGWLNIDLKTGKTVRLSKFVDNRKNVFYLEVGRAIAKKEAEGWMILGNHGRDTLSSWKGYSGWTVSSKGVKVYYGWDIPMASYQVKWERILKPGQVAGKKKYTSKARYSCSDDSKSKKVTVQGNFVTVQTPWETFHGVRGKSKKVLVWSKNYGPSGGGLSEVTFTSATSKAAKYFTQRNYC